MSEFIMSANIFVHLALLFYSLGFMVRDELWLRGLVFVGTVFYILYYAFISDSPLWDAIFASVVLGVINVWMIGVIILERTKLTMSRDVKRAYACFPNLNPGQFRRVIKKANQKSAEQEMALTHQGMRSDKLFLILDGSAEMQKDDVVCAIKAPMFIGEIGFLKNTSASATVTVSAGTTFFEWNTADLNTILNRKVAIKNAMIALFSKDLAHKLEHSIPKNAVRRTLIPSKRAPAYAV